MRQLLRIGWIAAAITAVVGLPMPAATAATGGITVPRTTLTVSASGSPIVVQKITTTQNVYSTQVTVEGGGARRVLQVLNKPSDVTVPAVCSGGNGTWSCGPLEPTGYLQITYTQAYGSAPLDLGTFAVAVSMGVNGQTLSGTGSVTVTTSAELEMLTPRLQLLAGDGYAWFRVRNNGVVPSPVTLTVGGLGTVPVDDQGNGCVRSGSSLTCQGTVPVGGSFGPQLKLTGNAWRSLHLTATVSGPYPDPKTGNNAVAVGPYDTAPPVTTGGTAGQAGPARQPTVTASTNAASANAASPSAAGTSAPSAGASTDPAVPAVGTAPVSAAAPLAGAPAASAHSRTGTPALAVVAAITVMTTVAVGVLAAFLFRRHRARSVA